LFITLFLIEQDSTVNDVVSVRWTSRVACRSPCVDDYVNLDVDGGPWT